MLKVRFAPHLTVNAFGAMRAYNVDQPLIDILPDSHRVQSAICMYGVCTQSVQVLYPRLSPAFWGVLAAGR